MTRTTGWCLVLVFLVLVALLFACGEKGTIVQGSRETGTMTFGALEDLDTGARLELAPGTCREHTVKLPEGHFVQIVADQLGLDLSLELRAPNGRAMVEVDSPIGDRGQERLSAVTEEAGDYILAVCSNNSKESPGGYSLSIEDARPATEVDRRLIAALAIFSEGESFRRERRRHEAIEKYQVALDTFRAVGDEWRQAEALHRIGWQAERLGRLTSAFESNEEAILLFRRLDDPRRLVALLNRNGSILCRLGQSARGLAAHQAALAAAREIEDVELEAGVLNNIGLAYQYRYQIQPAIETLQEALLRGRGTPVEAKVWHNLGKLLMDQGRLEDALDAFHRSLNLKRLAGRTTPDETWDFLGDALVRLDRFEEAIPYLEQAIEERRRRSNTQAVGFSLNNLANALLKADRLDEALANSREAVDILQHSARSREWAISLMNLGRILLRRGDTEAALEQCDRALRLFESISDPWGEAASHHCKAKALHARRQYSEALEHLEVAIARVEDLRAQVVSQRLQMSFFATKQSYYELMIDVLMHLAELEPDAERAASLAAQAIQVTEQRQARILLDVLGESTGNHGFEAPELVVRESELQRQLNGLAWATARAEDEEATERLASLQKRQRETLLELDTVRQKIRRSHPVDTGLTQSSPLALDEIQAQVVDAGTLLLVFSLGEERSFLWCISADGMTYHVLPERSRIERIATRVYRSLTQEHRASERPRHTAALSRMLLGPVAGQLDRKRLAIVAEGRLLDIPFAALPVPGDRGLVESNSERLLIEDYEIVYLPSASVLASLRRKVRDRSAAPVWLAIVADPVFGIDDPRVARHATPQALASPGGDEASEGPWANEVARSARALGLDTIDRLPGTSDEAQAIAAILGDESQVRLWSGFDARREAVVGDALKPYRIVHFATHGLVNREHPELSGLILSLIDRNGAWQNGFLRAFEIYDLELSADLVVLSACETGVGQEIAGEGQVALTRGFMDAGAPRVVVSRWRVGDHGTAELMERFYFGMIENGLTPSQALRCAQLSMRMEEAWSDPAHWAGFVVEGEWRSIGGFGESVEATDTGAHEEEGPGSDMPILDGAGSRDPCGKMFRAWKLRETESRTSPGSAGHE